MTTHILHRQTKTPMPVIASGEGVYLKIGRAHV